jgi:ketosteroid isomerase-like protein
MLGVLAALALAALRSETEAGGPTLDAARRAADTGREMSQEDDAMAFRRAMEAYSRGDYEAAVIGFDPAIEWSVHASLAPDATTYHGHEGVKRFWATWAEAISGMELEIEECRHVGPNQVLAITRAHGTGAGSGAPVASGRFAQIADFREGRVVRVRLYGNVAQALEDAGLRE